MRFIHESMFHLADVSATKHINFKEFMKERPKFSVLLSFYHKENPDFFRQSLKSMEEQTLRADETVLVEDGPVTPELDALAEDFKTRMPNVKIIRLPMNVNLGKALNEGLKHCSHNLVARMDADDVAKPQRFEKQVNFMAEHPDVDIVSAWMEEFNESTDNVFSVKALPATHEEICKYLKKRNPFNHPTVMFRKKAVLRAGGYLHKPLFEDWYLWARMYLDGARFANIQESLLYFRASDEMYRRRGGYAYALQSAKFQWTLNRLGVISPFKAIQSNLLRSTVYLLPNSVRRWIYSTFLRKK